MYGKKESVPKKVEQAEITEMHMSWNSKLKEAHPRRYVNAHECTELKRSSFFPCAARNHDTKGLEAEVGFCEL